MEVLKKVVLNVSNQSFIFKKHKNKILLWDNFLNKMDFNVNDKISIEVEDYRLKIFKDPTGEFKVELINDILSIKIKASKVQMFFNNLSNTEPCCIDYIKDEQGYYLIISLKEPLTPSNNISKEKLTAISFCAGGGVSSFAEKEAGFKHIAFCECDYKYSQVYSSNFPDSLIFNCPIQSLNSTELQYADLWTATLCCTDFSNLKSDENKYNTIHLFTHLLRLLWTTPVNKRPLGILVENVPSFKNVAGNSLKLALEEMDYKVTHEIINSIDFKSRTKRERYFLFATCYEGFKFPISSGKLDNPISEDGIITVDNVPWKTDDDRSFAYYSEREKKDMKHNHKMSFVNINIDSHFKTITKSHASPQPQIVLKHPTEDKHAFIRDLEINQIKYIQGIPDNFKFSAVDGNISKTQTIEIIGQSVCYKTFFAISKSINEFLKSQLS